MSPRCARYQARRAPWIVATLVLLAGCMRPAPPEEVALRYGRAVYAADAKAIWRLVSTADQGVKDEAAFRRQQRQLRGVTREVVGLLAGFISASPVRMTIDGGQASVTLRFRIPDANAPEIRALVHDWDEDRLDRLVDAERARVRERLAELHRSGRLPTVEGDETIQLVREADGWRVFLNWAEGARVRFAASVDPALPLEATVTPASIVLAPGERVRVTVRATNTSSRDVTTRVGHRIEPGANARHLALLVCPLVVPVTLKPGATEEFASEYLLLADAPREARAFDVTYQFPAPSSVGGR